MNPRAQPVPSPTGPAEGTAAVGVDRAPDRRPGVPMEARPEPYEGVHWTTPPRQRPRKRHLKRKGLEELTPVFGTAQPPRGVSGLLRRFAYGLPEHETRHWLTLMVADRIDVVEGRLGRRLARPLWRRGMDAAARGIERNPAAGLALAAAAITVLGLGIRGVVRR